ncbi:hypothetical protein H696_03104 [Fonticula alba]|uniref:Amino acid transporter n=1 Tax=Fonticula alba TaxID=691883 RepID=A0A058Z9Z2_FONAL|nr:hypothetical protein H696_03104 [Fonticula alba]KCV70753.1 hypothetical protein H696_03104 [Fonticula alba]|eukprot:XP_009495269.1 hypothetical protein H696_03104 [Fonticula alba]
MIEMMPVEATGHHFDEHTHSSGGEVGLNTEDVYWHGHPLSEHAHLHHRVPLMPASTADWPDPDQDHPPPASRRSSGSFGGGGGGGGGRKSLAMSILELGDDVSRRAQAGCLDLWRHPTMVTLTLLGAVLGIGAGVAANWLIPAESSWREVAVFTLAAPGIVFSRALRALSMPMVVIGVVCSIIQLQLYQPGSRGKRARSIAATTAAWFALTTVCAGILGAVLGALTLTNTSAQCEYDGSLSGSRNGDDWNGGDISGVDALRFILEASVPDNMVEAALNMNGLGLIVCSVAMAVGIGQLGDLTDALKNLFLATRNLIVHIISWVLVATPVGIFSLIAGRVAEDGAVLTEHMTVLGAYLGVLFAGLILHSVVLLPALASVFGRVNAFKLMWPARTAVLTALGTASPAGTLPNSIAACTNGPAQCAEETARFVCGAGCLLHPNAMALSSAIAAVFVSSVCGSEGSPSALQLLATIAAAPLSGLAAASIPDSGAFALALVVVAAGAPPEAAMLVVPVDWLLVRFRVAVNVWADIVVCACVDRRFPEAPRLGAAAEAAIRASGTDGLSDHRSSVGSSVGGAGGPSGGPYGASAGGGPYGGNAGGGLGAWAGPAPEASTRDPSFHSGDDLSLKGSESDMNMAVVAPVPPASHQTGDRRPLLAAADSHGPDGQAPFGLDSLDMDQPPSARFSISSQW